MSQQREEILGSATSFRKVSQVPRTLLRFGLNYSSGVLKSRALIMFLSIAALNTDKTDKLYNFSHVKSYCNLIFSARIV